MADDEADKIEGLRAFLAADAGRVHGLQQSQLRHGLTPVQLATVPAIATLVREADDVDKKLRVLNRTLPALSLLLIAQLLVTFGTSAFPDAWRSLPLSFAWAWTGVQALTTAALVLASWWYLRKTAAKPPGAVPPPSRASGDGAGQYSPATIAGTRSFCKKKALTTESYPRGFPAYDSDPDDSEGADPTDSLSLRQGGTTI
ncbi:hypothetical protein DIPPA_00316 [Diplonema papillatum]|nr:hypothetical protein DIPPA_00316 [Diplonema papillatum]